MSTADSIDRLTPTRRPPGSAIGYHLWSDLLFVHWRVPASVLKPHLPGSLTVDTYDGSAWLGLVPFHMAGVRPWWSPPVPWVSAFHETNVRTYVHWQGTQPGVWFFSLDAAQSLAVWLARTLWSLPYFRASMTLERQGCQVRYAGTRRRPALPAVNYEIEAEITRPTEPIPPTAQPGTLEHFLIERYLLYTTDKKGRLLRGQVHHAAYPLRPARVTHLKETLTASIHSPAHSPDHVVFSEGVQVEIFPLSEV